MSNGKMNVDKIKYKIWRFIGGNPAYLSTVLILIGMGLITILLYINPILATGISILWFAFSLLFPLFADEKIQYYKDKLQNDEEKRGKGLYDSIL